jgi:hypothetical protein
MAYQSPGERLRRQDRLKDNDSAAKKLVNERRLTAAGREIAGLLDILADKGYPGVKPIEVVEPVGLMGARRAHPDNVTHYAHFNAQHYDSSAQKLRGQFGANAIGRYVTGLTGRHVLSSQVVVEATVGWDVSRKQRAPREGTRSFSRPVSDANSVLITPEGTVFERFTPVDGLYLPDEGGRPIDGFAADVRYGRPFDDEANPLSANQQDLIVDHLRFHAANIDARHAR